MSDQVVHPGGSEASSQPDPSAPLSAGSGVFTATFAYDLKAFPENPHHVDTPFGRPQTVGIGDEFTRFDELREVAIDLRAALQAMLEEVREVPAMQGRQYVDLGIQVNAALRKAEWI